MGTDFREQYETTLAQQNKISGAYSNMWGGQIDLGISQMSGVSKGFLGSKGMGTGGATGSFGGALGLVSPNSQFASNLILTRGMEKISNSTGNFGANLDKLYKINKTQPLTPKIRVADIRQLMNDKRGQDYIRSRVNFEQLNKDLSEYGKYPIKELIDMYHRVIQQDLIKRRNRQGDRFSDYFDIRIEDNSQILSQEKQALRTGNTDKLDAARRLSQQYIRSRKE